MRLPNTMTVSEFREYIGCSREKAYQLVRLRTFPAYKVGNRHYVDRNRVDDWLRKFYGNK